MFLSYSSRWTPKGRQTAVLGFSKNAHPSAVQRESNPGQMKPNRQDPAKAGTD